MVQHTLVAQLCSVVAWSLAAAALTGCNDQELFAKPTRAAGTAPSLAVQDSTVGARVLISLDTLRAGLESALPQTLSGVARLERRPCAHIQLLRTRHCVNVDANYTASRGAVSMVASGPNSIRVSAPVSIDGHGNIRGSGDLDRFVIRTLSLGRKNFNGSAVLTADISLGIGEDWCPKPVTKLNLQWISGPRFEALHRVWVDVRPLLGSQISSAVQAVERSVAQAIPCETARTQAKQLFAARSVPVQLPMVGQAFVNVRPTGAGFSGLAVTPETVSMAFHLSAKTDLTSKESTVQFTDLPPLQHIANEAPRIRLAVPVRPTYNLLTKAANDSLAGKIFKVDTPAGKAKATVVSVEVYPAGDRVAVGVNAVLDVPGKWFDVKGDIYVLGMPQVNGTVVSLKNVGLAQVLDNKAWDYVSAALRDRIIWEITQATRYDIAKDVVTAQQEIEKAVAKLSTDNSLQIKPINAHIRLERVAVALETLEVEGIFEATLDTTVKSLAQR
jgi:hypothetical protein